MWSHHSHHRGRLLSRSSPSHVCVLQWRDSGLKMSLSIGIKFSSPACQHPISSPFLPLVTILSPLLSSLLSPSYVCVLQWNKMSLSIGIKFSSPPSCHHAISSPLLPLVTILCVCPAMEQNVLVYWYQVLLSSFLSPCYLLSSPPSCHHPMCVSCNGEIVG